MAPIIFNDFAITYAIFVRWFQDYLQRDEKCFNSKQSRQILPATQVRFSM